MATRNVVLTSEQEKFIADLIRSGRFQNASEAMRAGLRLLQDEEAQSAELRQRLSTSLADAQDGERAEGSGAEAVSRAFDRAKAAFDRG